MSNTTIPTTPMGNPRAEAIFVASGLPDTEQVRKAIRQDAHYMMNCTGYRYSDAVASACGAFPRLSSPTALAILAESDPYA